MSNKSDKLAQFLNDFALYNEDSFEPEQITQLFEAADKIRDLQEMVDYYTEYFDDIGVDPHTEAHAARAEEGKKRQEEYRKRHEERMALIAAAKNADANTPRL